MGAMPNGVMILDSNLKIIECNGKMAEILGVPSHRVQMDVRFDEVVLRSLAKAPECRYQHADDLLAAAVTYVARTT